MGTRVSSAFESDSDAGPPLVMAFEDNALLPALFGEHDRHIARIEQAVGVILSSRGNRVSIGGDAYAQKLAKTVLRNLYERLERGQEVGPGAVEGAIRMAKADGGRPSDAGEIAIQTRKRTITPRSPTQRT